MEPQYSSIGAISKRSHCPPEVLGLVLCLICHTFVLTDVSVLPGPSMLATPSTGV